MNLKTYIRLSGQESTLKYLLAEPKVRGRRALGKLFNIAPKRRSFVFLTSLPHPKLLGFESCARAPSVCREEELTSPA